MSRHLWSIFLAVVTVATAVYALSPDPVGRDLAWLVVSWGAVAAIVVGIFVHRPAARGPWWLMTVGLSLAGVAWIVQPISHGLSTDTPAVVVAEVFHLGTNVMIGGALVWFARLQTPDDDRESVVDGVIVAVALVTVLWSVVIDPAALGADATVSGRVVYIVAPILPAGIAAVCIRLLFAAGGRLASARLLGGAWLLTVVGTIGWILLLQADAYVPGGWIELLWAAALGCAGASALHPSMVEMSVPSAATHRRVSTARLTVLGLALLATPAAMLTTFGVADVHVALPVVGAGLIAVLVLGRLARLIDEREQGRHDLEVQAARQEVVARVGEAALGEQPIGSLYAEAASLAAGVLENVSVTIRSNDEGRRSGDTQNTLLTLPVSGGDRTGVTLDVVARPGRELSADERAFVAAVAAVLSGMTARRHAEDDLRRRALYDDLTGLPNRVLVLERLEHAVVRRDRGPVGVLFVDLDGFKPINDEHGHEAGDALLTILAARLPIVLRHGDTVGRLAGDEFVVVAPDCDEAGLADLAVRLLRSVSEPVEVGDNLVSVTASVGAALAVADDRCPRQVLRRADAAMYEAKDAGGGTISFEAIDATRGGRNTDQVPSATLRTSNSGG